MNARIKSGVTMASAFLSFAATASWAQVPAPPPEAPMTLEDAFRKTESLITHREQDRQTAPKQLAAISDGCIKEPITDRAKAVFTYEGKIKELRSLTDEPYVTLKLEKLAKQATREDVKQKATEAIKLRQEAYALGGLVWRMIDIPVEQTKTPSRIPWKVDGTPRMRKGMDYIWNLKKHDDYTCNYPMFSSLR